MNLCYIEENFVHLNLLKEFVKDNIALVSIKSIEELHNGELLIVTKDFIKPSAGIFMKDLSVNILLKKEIDFI